jgi:DNA-directed RNA polymerase specialized sigma24 family protein
LEQLLADSAWLERLALRLARHDDDAWDAIQDTWVAALRSPPDRNRPPGPWLASVLRHLVHRQRRQRRRRQLREYQATAFASQTTEPASNLLERVQLHRTLTGLVLELEEPFRSTVLRSDVDHPAIQRLSAHITAHQISEGARTVALELAGKRRGDEKPADAAIAATAALYRQQLALADRFEATLAERLGAERARFLRRGPLAGRTRRAGCM